MHIVHKDGDPLNNLLYNLELVADAVYLDGMTQEVTARIEYPLPAKAALRWPLRPIPSRAFFIGQAVLNAALAETGTATGLAAYIRRRVTWRGREYLPPGFHAAIVEEFNKLVGAQ